MDSGPSKIAEAIVSIFVPPACREEVLGDLHERFQSPLQYAAEALHTVPLVIVSRMRRTADPQILLIQAFVFYLSFLGAAWLKDGTLLREKWGLLRLAIPAAMALLGLVLDDTYTNPGRQSTLNLARGPLLGLVWALGSQVLLGISNPALALPRWIAFYGCTTSLLLSTAVRILFPPIPNQPLGANAPAFWLKRAGESNESQRGMNRALQGMAAIVAVALVGTWMAEGSVPPRGVIMLLAVLVVIHVMGRQG